LPYTKRCVASLRIYSQKTIHPPCNQSLPLFIGTYKTIIFFFLYSVQYNFKKISSLFTLQNEKRVVLTGFRDCTSILVHGKRAKNLHTLPSNSTKGLNWLAPEVLEQNILGYTEKSDIYSLGITTCELANGVEPFSNMPKTLMFTEKVRGNQPSLLDFSTCPSEEVIGRFSVIFQSIAR
jgi:STE20-related kinase adapter protein alpha